MRQTIRKGGSRGECRQRREQGLTLLELVAATGIFALVSLMALQALTSGLIQRRGIEALDGEQASMVRLLTLIRQDLSAAIPLPWLAGTGAEARPLYLLPSGGFALSRGGLPATFELGDPGLSRVVWRVDADSLTLLRQVLPLNATVTPEPSEHVVMQGVGALRLTTLGDWVDAPDGLPQGFLVEIDTQRWGLLRVVVAR